MLFRSGDRSEDVMTAQRVCFIGMCYRLGLGEKDDFSFREDNRINYGNFKIINSLCSKEQ